MMGWHDVVVDWLTAAMIHPDQERFAEDTLYNAVPSMMFGTVWLLLLLLLLLLAVVYYVFVVGWYVCLCTTLVLLSTITQS